ncbi:hypothetical protein IVB30_20745 [Bradyrhizobium sp. 200]|uniref:hypothetical protein n=1 Tax=Bradyrhizobium sp. 200 TaxID=2782665 RepID=UPI001FFF810B|nr:hypothetical protein [Bradyrhizobium sp. 200]UPJ53523.1 hypothetical protein IVB30_20745 [Bradyrhizobium sp. 200]
MPKLSRLVVAVSAAALVFLPTGAALAQGAPSSETAPTAPAATSTAAPEAKGPENKGPENKASENAAPEKEKAAPKKKKPAKMTRQQEIDRSIDRGTVPARYRSSVPKEYHQYIPFDKR